MLLTKKRLDEITHCPDSCLGFDFSELESTQNLP
jgi:hypothetical protein